MTDHPTTTRISIWLILILFLSGCRSHATATPTPAPTPTTQAAPVLAALNLTPAPAMLENGWYVYRDPDGEFSFAYPPTATLTAGQNPVDLSKNIIIQFRIPDQSYQGMSIRIEPNPKRLPAADFARQLYETSAQQPAAATFTDSLQSIQVGGISGVKTQLPSTNTELTIIVPYEVQVFIVSPVHELSMTQVEPGTLELFYQILNTVKFGGVQ
jgi:hypothetical protein